MVSSPAGTVVVVVWVVTVVAGDVVVVVGAAPSSFPQEASRATSRTRSAERRPAARSDEWSFRVVIIRLPPLPVPLLADHRGTIRE
jgi:class 3 adenylate cyclase